MTHPESPIPSALRRETERKAGLAERRRREREERRDADQRRREAMREVMRRRAETLKRSPSRRRVAEEEARLQRRRVAVLQAARLERRERAERGLEDLTVTEQCDRNAYTLRASRSDAAPARRVRRGVAHDPAFRFDAALVSAAQRLEKLAAEAARLGGGRNCLADPAGGEGDPDAARARMVRADREMRRIMAALPDAPEMRSDDGPRSQRDAIVICVLEERPLSALAASTVRGAAYREARALLERALESLAEITGDKRPERRAA